MFKGTLINKTGYVVFEIGTQCNLGHLHAKCPNQHPDRYKHVDTSRVMSDDTIVDTAVALIQEHGFRGLIGWHYYNEPTLEDERMFRLMRLIRENVPRSEFVLWTNSEGLPWDCQQYEREFCEIHVTDYGLDDYPCRVDRLTPMDKVHVHRWPLDDRLTTTGDEPGRVESDAPCCRMFTEMIFDYYGNVHLCCYDWRGLGTGIGGGPLGNISWPLPHLVGVWQTVRQHLIGEKMTDRPSAENSILIDNIPQVCRTCTAPGRTTHITDFVKAPAEAARAYREEVLNRGK